LATEIFPHALRGREQFGITRGNDFGGKEQGFDCAEQGFNSASSSFNAPEKNFILSAVRFIF